MSRVRWQPLQGRQTSWLVAPYAVTIVTVAVVPMAALLARAIADGEAHAAFARVWHEEAYAAVFRNTLVVCGSATCLSLLLGYPLGLVIGASSPPVRGWLTALVMVPMWTSVLVRTYAWTVLLQREGMVNDILRGVGLINAPMSLMQNRIGATLGMTYVLVPFMALMVSTAVARVDERLLLAAESLGATPWERWVRVVLPLSADGLLVGTAAVAVLSLGLFVTPALLGGPRETTLAVLVDQTINRLSDWSLGTAIAVCLIGAALCIVAVGVAGIRWLASSRSPLERS